MTKSVTLRENQTPPEGVKVFLCAGGRASGKTQAGASWASTDPVDTIIVGRTDADLDQTLLRGESGLGNKGAYAGVGFRVDRQRVWQHENESYILPVSMERVPQSLGEISGRSGISPKRVWIDEAQNLRLRDWKLIKELYPDAEYFLGFTPTDEKNKLLTYLYRRAYADRVNYAIGVNNTLDNVAHLSYRYIEQVMATWGGTQEADSIIRGIYDIRHYA